jgi:RNA polymerase sporulation-specific sigma factor
MTSLQFGNNNFGGDLLLGKVELSGINTASLKVLSEDKKTELLKRMKNGDKFAREELIQGNLKLVLSVIQKFTRRHDSPDDLFQVGCIGLIKAVDNFDVSQNVRFSTYAVPMIIGELRRFLRDNNMIKVSRSVRDLAYKALEERENLTVKLGREPSNEELTKAVNLRLKETAIEREEEFITVSEKDVTNALDAVIDPVSLYDPVYSDNGDTIYLMDQIRDHKCADEHWIEYIALEEAVKHLGNREKNILHMRYFLGRTQMEVAHEIGISQAQVSRLEKGALLRIRKQM